MNESEEAARQQLLEVARQLQEKQRKREQRTEPRDPPDYAQLCRQRARHDFWPVSEGLNLLFRYHPEKQYWTAELSEAWEVAERSIGPGGSLAVVNPDARGLGLNRAKKYRVRPRDLLSWARKKGYPIPPELESAVLGLPGSEPVRSRSTAAAVTARKSEKAQRQELLRRFIDDIYARAQARGLHWAANTRRPLPVTKADLREAFYQLHGDRLNKPVAQATFNDDLRAVGAACRQGTRPRKDNVLVMLFPELKQG